MAHWSATQKAKSTILATLLLPTLPLYARDLCADLLALQNAQPEFADFRGDPAPDDRWHTKPDNLGGMGECTLGTSGKFANVMCTSPWISDEQSANSKRESSVAAIKQCLGDGWNASEDRIGGGTTTIRFFKAGENTNFALALYRHTLSESKWQIWFNAMMFAQGKAKSSTELTRNDPVELSWRNGDKTLCKDLSTVVAGAKDRFNSLRGRKVGSSWLPSHVIAGVNRCRIFQTKSGLDYYSCETTNEIGEQESKTVFKTLASDVQECLPKPWIIEKGLTASGMPYVQFIHPHEVPKVVIRLSGSDNEFVVKLDVDAE